MVVSISCCQLSLQYFSVFPKCVPWEWSSGLPRNQEKATFRIQFQSKFCGFQPGLPQLALCSGCVIVSPVSLILKKAPIHAASTALSGQRMASLPTRVSCSTFFSRAFQTVPHCRQSPHALTGLSVCLDSRRIFENRKCETCVLPFTSSLTSQSQQAV